MGELPDWQFSNSLIVGTEQIAIEYAPRIFWREVILHYVEQSFGARNDIFCALAGHLQQIDFLEAGGYPGHEYTLQLSHYFGVVAGEVFDCLR